MNKHTGWTTDLAESIPNQGGGGRREVEWVGKLGERTGIYLPRFEVSAFLVHYTSQFSNNMAWRERERENSEKALRKRWNYEGERWRQIYRNGETRLWAGMERERKKMAVERKGSSSWKIKCFFLTSLMFFFFFFPIINAFTWAMTIVTKPKDKAKPTENYHIVISIKSYKSLATNICFHSSCSSMHKHTRIKETCML